MRGRFTIGWPPFSIEMEVIAVIGGEDRYTRASTTDHDLAHPSVALSRAMQAGGGQDRSVTP